MHMKFLIKELHNVLKFPTVSSIILLVLDDNAISTKREEIHENKFGYWSITLKRIKQNYAICARQKPGQNECGTQRK